MLVHCSLRKYLEILEILEMTQYWGYQYEWDKRCQIAKCSFILIAVTTAHN